MQQQQTGESPAPLTIETIQHLESLPRMKAMNTQQLRQRALFKQDNTKVSLCGTTQIIGCSSQGHSKCNNKASRIKTKTGLAMSSTHGMFQNESEQQEQ